jgi:hypothetical protein
MPGRRTRWRQRLIELPRIVGLAGDALHGCVGDGQRARQSSQVGRRIEIRAYSGRATPNGDPKGVRPLPSIRPRGSLQRIVGNLIGEDGFCFSRVEGVVIHGLDPFGRLLRRFLSLINDRTLLALAARAPIFAFKDMPADRADVSVPPEHLDQFGYFQGRALAAPLT